MAVVYIVGFRKFWRVNSGNSGTVSTRWQDLLQVEMTGPPRGSIQVDEASSFQDPNEDGCRHIFVVQDLSPLIQWLVGCVRPFPQVPIIHDTEEHVGSVRPVGQISHLIDDEDVRVQVGCQRFLEISTLVGVREVLDEFGRGGEESLEAVLVWMARYRMMATAR
jgi:hypothetical protein